MNSIKHKIIIRNKQKDAHDRIAEFIDYVKVQHEVKSANSTGKEKIVYFNRKGVKRNGKIFR